MEEGSPSRVVPEMGWISVDQAGRSSSRKSFDFLRKIGLKPAFQAVFVFRWIGTAFANELWCLSFAEEITRLDFEKLEKIKHDFKEINVMVTRSELKGNGIRSGKYS